MKESQFVSLVTEAVGAVFRLEQREKEDSATPCNIFGNKTSYGDDTYSLSFGLANICSMTYGDLVFCVNFHRFPHSNNISHGYETGHYYHFAQFCLYPKGDRAIDGLGGVPIPYPVMGDLAQKTESLKALIDFLLPEDMVITFEDG